MTIRSALQLPVPRNATATMQLIQRLVGRDGHRHWCGGEISLAKAPAFLEKMFDRYPQLLRNARGRSYDRTRGKAAMHMIVCPPVGSPLTGALPTLLWFLLSDSGKGGLADETSPDFIVSRNAMASSHHVIASDYVLVYGTKRQPRIVPGRGCDRGLTVWRSTSTWSWRIRSDIVVEIRAAIQTCCHELQFGAEPAADRTGSGLCGLLAAQRNRPLFAGVRNQVVDLYRYAREEVWPRYRSAWQQSHPKIAQEQGSSAGQILSTHELTKYHLPTMSRIALYAEPAMTVGELLRRST
jgi:hypothetical protein